MKTLLKIFYLLPVIVVAGVVGYLATNRSKMPPVHVMSGRPFASTAITNLTASLFTPGGQLGPAANDVFIEFRDNAGKLVDVGEVRFELGLTAPGAIMHSLFKVLRTSTPGQYRATVVPQIAGEWKATLSLTAPSTPAHATFLVNVK